MRVKIISDSTCDLSPALLERYDITVTPLCVIKDGKLANWQAVVPTTWNASPRDNAGNHGAYEASLIGTPLADPKRPLEIIRTIHSFDPCLACATHVLSPEGEELVRVQVR